MVHHEPEGAISQFLSNLLRPEIDDVLAGLPSTLSQGS